nr:hypothetical protein [Tanacetum cinerariifolium]
MGGEHLDTIPATESDEFIKSSFENLVPNPSESEGENGCDVPACFTTFSNDLFDADYEFDSVDDQSLHNEDVLEKIFSNPLFEEEIISIKKTHITLTLTDIESFSPSSIPDEDSDSQLTSNYSLSLPEIESFYFDIPLFSRPLAKPPDGNIGILNIKMMGDISDQKVPIPKLTITHVPNQEKSPDLLSHRGFEIFQLFAKRPMMISGKNIPFPDVSLFHFYPLDQLNLLHLAGSQPMLKSSYKAEDGVIICIPPIVGGVADVVVEIKGTGWGKMVRTAALDISSKESTLQLVYDVLRQNPFFKAFLVTTDVPEIYMQELWATAMVHHSIRFKMDNKKHIVEHKDTKKSNEMYYPRFTKVIIHYFMSKDPLIPRRNKVNWHYVRDDQMFTMIKLVSRHQNTQQFGAMLPIELINVDIKNSEAYKEYYAVATGATPPKTKANEGTGTIPGVLDVPTEESDEEISWKSSDEGDDDDDDKEGSDDQSDSDAQDDDDDQEEGDDDDDHEEGNDDDQDSDEEGEEFIHPRLSIHDKEETRDEESFDPIPKMLKNTDDEGNGKENLGLNEGRGVQMADVHTTQEFEDSHVTLTPVNHDGQQQSSSVSSQFMTRMLNPTPDAGIKSIFETTSQMDVQAPTTVAPLPLSAPTLTPLTTATISTVTQAPTPPTTNPSTLLQNLPNFDRLRDEAQAENEEFLKNLDENIQKIIKEQVKEQVKVQVSKILPKIEQTVNEQLEAKVLTRSSNSSKTSYAVAVDLSEMELKKILIEKMEGNKSIHQSNDQKNLYKALTKMKNPPLDPTRGPRDEEKEMSQSQQALQRRKLPGALASLHKGLNLDKRLQASLQQQNRDWNKTLPTTHGSIQPWISELAKQIDSLSSFNELIDTHVDFSAFLVNRLKVDTLTSKLLAGPTYELMKGSCKSLVEFEFFLKEVYKETTDQLDWINPKGQQYPHNMLNTDIKLPRESARDVYSKHRIIAVTELKIVEWHNYKHLDWITLTNMMVEECFAFNVSLRMFTRSIVIQRRVEDLQLSVESYQKNLNLTRPDSYRSDLKRKESAYSNPRGFIYQNNDKKNRLMRIDELHKFSDGKLTDVRTALDNRLKGILMKYLPQTIWRKSDKERTAAMIQVIDKQLKTRMIMRSLE